MQEERVGYFSTRFRGTLSRGPLLSGKPRLDKWAKLSGDSCAKSLDNRAQVCSCWGAQIAGSRHGFFRQRTPQKGDSGNSRRKSQPANMMDAKEGRPAARARPFFRVCSMKCELESAPAVAPAAPAAAAAAAKARASPAASSAILLWFGLIHGQGPSI